MASHSRVSTVEFAPSSAFEAGTIGTRSVDPVIEAPARRRERRWVRLSTPWAYLAPMLVLLAVFTYWPFIHTFYLSFIDWNLNPDQATKFVGFANYRGVVGSPVFAAAAWNTLIYLLAAIPLMVLLPIPLAIFVWSLGTGGHVYRTILFLPTLLSFVVVSIAWLWLISPLGGYMQQLLWVFGLTMPNFLADPKAAIWVILGISAWKVLGFNMLFYLAGLTSINHSLIEAMRLDGAGDGTIVRHLLWPLLTPTTFFVLIATIIFTIQQVFTPIDIMTQGGPSSSTTNLFYMVYQYTFTTFNVGYGAAGTVILFVLLLGIILFKIRMLDRYVQFGQ